LREERGTMGGYDVHIRYKNIKNLYLRVQPPGVVEVSAPQGMTGADIEIEQRPPEEVTEMWYSSRMAPKGINVYNPAFDVTDHSLITAFVTEHGVLRAPYAESLRTVHRNIPIHRR